VRQRFPPTVVRPVLERRRIPRQERSRAVADAVVQATREVLLDEGAASVTTTRVAQRAGVSVGSLYQYFPNRTALLRALFSVHLEVIERAVVAAVDEARGLGRGAGLRHVLAAFLEVKRVERPTSVAFQPVLGEFEGSRLVTAASQRVAEHLAVAFEAWSNGPVPAVTAFALCAAIDGAVSAMLAAHPGALDSVEFLGVLERMVEATVPGARPQTPLGGGGTAPA
jgi:AcrR family transcriptional regulator